MKTSTSDAIRDTIDEVGRVFGRFVRIGLHTIATASWPQLLLACIGLAMLAAILPLAISLFVIFMIIKLSIAAVVVHTHRHGKQ